MRKLSIAALGALLLALLSVTFLPVQAQEEVPPTDNDFAMPYPNYTIKGGCHDDHWSVGISCALDVNSIPDSGKLYSPITGWVVDVGTNDGFTNPYVIIKNTCRTVYMLHGIYDVVAGQKDIKLGQLIGREASKGNSTGPHTHLTVYDQCKGIWVDPSSIVTVKLGETEIKVSMEEAPVTQGDSSPDPQPGQFGPDLQMPSVIATQRAAIMEQPTITTVAPTLAPESVGNVTSQPAIQTPEVEVNIGPALDRILNRRYIPLIVAAVILVGIFLISGDRKR